MCPKSLPTHTIIHRIEFQESEREIIRDLAMAYQINKVSEPLVALINDNTTMLLILGAAGAYLGFTYIPPVLDEGINLLADFKLQLDTAIEQGTLWAQRQEARYEAGAERAGQVRDFAVWNAPGPLGPAYRGIDWLERRFGIDLFDFGAGWEPGDPTNGGGGGGGF